MPLRRTERSDGQKRPRWKDGSHARVKNSNATRSPSTGPDSIVRFPTESPTTFASMPRCGPGRPSFTRGRRANAGADARIEESGAKGEVRLAILSCGRRFSATHEGGQLRRPSRAPNGEATATFTGDELGVFAISATVVEITDGVVVECC